MKKRLLGMESSDSNSCDDTDGWVTVKDKRSRKALINKDSPGHSTTKHVNGVTKVIKVESRSPTKHQKVEE